MASRSKSTQAGTREVQPECSAATTAVLQQIAANVGTAALTWLKGVLTVTNISKCFGDAAESIEDRLGGGGSNKKSRCPDPSPDNSSKLPAGNSKHAVKPTIPQHVQYPSSFNEEASVVAGRSRSAVKWNLADKSSVISRWKDTA